MSLCARLDQNGRLADIGNREPNPGDVPLDAMPTGFGPFAYDAVNRLAIPATLTQAEKLNRVPIEARVLGALAIRMSATWSALTPARQAAVQSIIDNAAVQIAALLT